jgi:glyoxylase-like metal-dependent hydrolase (beta-lactamase superfamily II)
MPDMTPGVASALSPLVRRIVANNPGYMTGPGTNTYLVGIDEVAVIDPGPEDAAHVEAIIGASMRERVRWVLLTHTHPDHWPAARSLADQTGAEILMFPVKGVDLEPDGWLDNGQVIEGTEFGLEVIHTPGHASNHVCFFLEEERAYFTGDHIMEGSTVVIPPPDGNMAHYLDSLELLKKRTRLTRIYPGHGEVIDDAKGKIQEYIEHRLMREAQIVGMLEEGPAKIPAIVARLYEGLNEAIVPRAEQTVLAHLLKLKRDGRVTGRDERSTWKIA